LRFLDWPWLFLILGKKAGRGSIHLTALMIEPIFSLKMPDGKTWKPAPIVSSA